MKIKKVSGVQILIIQNKQLDHGGSMCACFLIKSTGVRSFMFCLWRIGMILYDRGALSGVETYYSDLFTHSHECVSVWGCQYIRQD